MIILLKVIYPNLALRIIDNQIKSLNKKLNLSNNKLTSIRKKTNNY